MAKDPAFLFYSSDFMMGTALMSEAEVGQYMRIMCHIHQSGHLSMEDMKNICPNISSKVVAKFKQDPAGRYYNERLEAEIQKRKKYSESRRNNRLKTHDTSYDKTHDSHMSTHMENENENRDVIEKKGVQGETEFKDYEHWTEDAVTGNDHLFTNMLRKLKVQPKDQLADLARSHLALLAKYPKMKPPDQNRFRISLIDHIAKEFKNVNNPINHSGHASGTGTKAFSGNYEERL